MYAGFSFVESPVNTVKKKSANTTDLTKNLSLSPHSLPKKDAVLCGESYFISPLSNAILTLFFSAKPRPVKVAEIVDSYH